MANTVHAVHTAVHNAVSGPTFSLKEIDLPEKLSPNNVQLSYSTGDNKSMRLSLGDHANLDAGLLGGNVVISLQSTDKKTQYFATISADELMRHSQNGFSFWLPLSRDQVNSSYKGDFATHAKEGEARVLFESSLLENGSRHEEDSKKGVRASSSAAGKYGTKITSNSVNDKINSLKAQYEARVNELEESNNSLKEQVEKLSTRCTVLEQEKNQAEADVNDYTSAVGILQVTAEFEDKSEVLVEKIRDNQDVISEVDRLLDGLEKKLDKSGAQSGSPGNPRDTEFGQKLQGFRNTLEGLQRDTDAQGSQRKDKKDNIYDNNTNQPIPDPDAISGFLSNLVELEPPVDETGKAARSLRDAVSSLSSDFEEKAKQIKDALAHFAEHLSRFNSLEASLIRIQALLKNIQQIVELIKDEEDYAAKKNILYDLSAKINEQLQAILDINARRDSLNKEVEELKVSGEFYRLVNLSQEELDEFVSHLKKTATNILGMDDEIKAIDTFTEDSRRRLADFEIPSVLGRRHDDLSELYADIKKYEEETDTFDKGAEVLRKSKPENDPSVTDLLMNLKGVRNLIDNAKKESDAFQETLKDIQTSTENRNLETESDYPWVEDTIKTLIGLKAKVQAIQETLSEVMRLLEVQKAKLGGVDIDNKIRERELELEDIEKLIAKIHKDIDNLESLFQDFDGYTSGNDELKLVSGSSSELKELRNLLNKAASHRDEIKGDLDKFKNDINKKRTERDLTTEELANVAADLLKFEEKGKKNHKAVKDIEKRVLSMRGKFEALDLFAKLKKREKDYAECDKLLKELINNNEGVDKLIEDEKQQVEEESYKVIIEDCVVKFGEIKTATEEVKAAHPGVGEEITTFKTKLTGTKPNELTPEVKLEYLRNLLSLKKLLVKHKESILALVAKFDKTKKYLQGSKPVKQTYKADLRDAVDKMLADYINQYGCPVRIERLGNGYYMFGTRKIFAKIINDKLVIRVGGGYMSIEEFVKQYGKQEFLKVQRHEQLQEEADIKEEEDAKALQSKQSEKKLSTANVLGIADAKKNLKASTKLLITAEQTDDGKQLNRGPSNKRLLESPKAGLEASINKADSARARATTMPKKTSTNELSKVAGAGLISKSLGVGTAVDRIEKSKASLGAANDKLKKLNAEFEEMDKSMKSISHDPQATGDRRKSFTTIETSLSDTRSKVDVITQQSAEAEHEYAALHKAAAKANENDLAKFEEKVNKISSTVEELVTSTGATQNTLKSFSKGGKDELYEIREQPSQEVSEKVQKEEEDAAAKSTPAQKKNTVTAKAGSKVNLTSPAKNLNATVGAKASGKGASASATASAKGPSSQELFSMLKGMEAAAKGKKDTGASGKYETIKLPKKK